MKKLFSIFLALLIVFSFAACGKPETDPEITPDDTPDAPASGNAIVIENYKVVDNEECTFTIVSIDPDDSSGYTMNVLLENHSDLELMFALDDVAVNGYMVDPFWASSVAAGKKENTRIQWRAARLEENNIDTIRVIEFVLRIYDNDDWFADDIVNDLFKIFPLGDTEDAIVFDKRVPVPGEIVLVDNEYCTFIITGLDVEDSFSSYAISIYLENKADYNMMFSIDDVSVNGFMCDPFWATTVSSGNRKNTTISWSESKFEENSIVTVEEIEFLLKIYNNDDWSADYLVKEVFTVTP